MPEGDVAQVKKESKYAKFKRVRERRQKVAEKLAALPPEMRTAAILVGHPPSEFEIQSLIYETLRRRGYEVRGEVPTRCGTARFDLVVYCGGEPARIIECKKKRRAMGDKNSKRKDAKHKREQIDRYGQFGIPVDVVCSLSMARLYLDQFSLFHPSNRWFAA